MQFSPLVLLIMNHILYVESEDENYLFGFVRLRIPGDKMIFPELKGCALIRELHIYGPLLPHDEKRKSFTIQHKGYGSLLIKQAEKIALQHHKRRIAIISGVGVRDYYKKRGYKLVNNNFMIKDLQNNFSIYFILLGLFFILLKKLIL